MSSGVPPGNDETPLLDASNPCDLVPAALRPDVRRYLTRLSGPPYPVDQLASQALDAVAKNKAIIVIPARARFVWRLMRAVPGTVERVARAAVSTERKLRA